MARGTGKGTGDEHMAHLIFLKAIGRAGSEKGLQFSDMLIFRDFLIQRKNAQGLKGFYRKVIYFSNIAVFRERREMTIRKNGLILNWP